MATLDRKRETTSNFEQAITADYDAETAVGVGPSPRAFTVAIAPLNLYRVRSSSNTKRSPERTEDAPNTKALAGPQTSGSIADRSIGHGVPVPGCLLYTSPSPRD